MKSFDALDDQMARPDSLDLRPHGDEEVAEVDDLRLARSVLELRLTFGENGSHERILGRSDGHHRKAEVAA